MFLRALSVGILVVLSGSLLGAEGCPLLAGEDRGAVEAGGSRIDVGGPGGALWQVAFADELLLTLRRGGEIASTQAGGAGAVQLLDLLVDVAMFCWRPDGACPQHVLAERTAIAQPEGAGPAVLVSFNRRGPLAARGGTALLGQLDGRELAVALPASGDGTCALRQPSAILATAYTTDGATPAESAQQQDAASPGLRAGELEGRVSVTYGGMCVAASGAGPLAAEDRLELSARFRARRVK